jgi:hypothetical protein
MTAHASEQAKMQAKTANQSGDRQCKPQIQQNFSSCLQNCCRGRLKLASGAGRDHGLEYFAALDIFDGSRYLIERIEF